MQLRVCDALDLHLGLQNYDLAELLLWDHHSRNEKATTRGLSKVTYE